MLSNYPGFDVVPSKSFGRSISQGLTPHGAVSSGWPALLGQGVDISLPMVDITPHRAVTRRGMEWNGMRVEFVQATMRERVEHSFRSPVHLLAAYQQGVRRDGKSCVEGAPRSTLRDVAKKLTFVPAGHLYREWYDPRTPTAVTYFYFDPGSLRIDSSDNLADILFEPRLFFEDTTIWSTAAKLRQAIDAPGGVSQLYVEALGVVLIHELVRLNRGASRLEATVRGGLAAWQQRVVAAYIEEHLSEQFARNSRGHGSIEYFSLLPGIQAIVRRAAASVPYEPPHRTRQGNAGRAKTFRDRGRALVRVLSRDKLLYSGVPENHRPDTPEPLPPCPRMREVSLQPRRLRHRGGLAFWIGSPGHRLSHHRSANLGRSEREVGAHVTSHQRNVWNIPHKRLDENHAM